VTQRIRIAIAAAMLQPQEGIRRVAPQVHVARYLIEEFVV
jgi:hypothetical protein